MPKILIAIDDNYLSNIYENLFQEKEFDVSVAKNENEVFQIICEDLPQIVLLDVVFAEKNDFELLKKIKNNESTKRIAIILYSKIKENGYKEKAIEFELKDFIVGSNSSPLDVLSKIRIHLSVEKSYKLAVDTSLETMKNLANDLGYESLNCEKCSKPLKIYLIRDLNKGDNYFKVSFICDNC